MSDLLTGPEFDGAVYQRELDFARLSGQIKRVFNVMQKGRWLTLAEISSVTGDPPASISAQLRNLRKRRFGAYTILRRARGNREHGLFEYRLAR
jgi:hypothetical protein